MTSWGNNMWLAEDYKLVPSKTDEWNSVQKVENRHNIKNEAKYMQEKPFIYLVPLVPSPSCPTRAERGREQSTQGISHCLLGSQRERDFPVLFSRTEGETVLSTTWWVPFLVSLS